ncbi:MAG: hypothetical protein IKI06_05605 [Prevotella sp.]|nr:hypothetical protein [Prevotella sp.]
MKRHYYIIITFLVLCCLPAMAQPRAGYYRVKNAGSGRYISMANDKFSYQFLFGQTNDRHFGNKPQIAGGFSNVKDHTSVVKPIIIDGAGVLLKNDIHLVEDADGIDASTIVYLQKGNGSKFNIIGQGTSLLTLTTGVYEASVRPIFKDIYTTISSSSPYTFSVEIKAAGVENISYNSLAFALGQSLFVSYANLGTRYFIDDNGSFGITQSNSDNNAKWYTESVSKLNVKATLEYKGKYYTTMYVPFAYTLGGDVLNAYVVTGVENQDDGTVKVIKQKIDGTIPAGTPVVLECASNDPSACYLNLTSEVPLYSPLNTISGLGDSTTSPAQYAPAATTATNYTGTNLLKGTYYQNEDTPFDYQYNRSGTNNSAQLDLHNTTTFSQGAVYVLGVGSSSGRLGFFKNSNTVMKANKAWLELPAGSANEAYALDFDEPIQEGGNDE